MAEGLTEAPAKSPADVTSAVAAAVAPADPLFGRRIEFHLERKPYSPISSAASHNFYLETLNPSSSNRSTAMVSAGHTSAAAAQSGKKSDTGFDPVFSFRITFRRIGAGLQNLGNTCYLNSVLQCLTYTEPLAAYCQSGEHKSSCRTAGFCAMCALQNHVMVALQSSGKILSPSHLVKNLRCISRNFRNSRQEDAHEYMVNLLESMHKCCLPSGVATESPSAYDKSLVYRIFGGRLRSQVKCTQCHYCSNKFDPFLDLSLEILKAESLRKALSHFTTMEQLDGGERQYQCQRCKEKVRAYKQLTVHKAPYVLTIHLKRFGPEIPGQKIDKKVDFEPTLDLKPFVSDPQEADLKYTLYGVLVHAGWSTHSGHYYCFVRTSSGMWHSLDDNQVRPVSEKTVLAQKAYMLFYVRDTSSVIKRSVDVVRKNNILAGAPGSKMISHPASTLNGAIQNAERKLGISEGSSAKSKAHGTSNGRPISVVGNLPRQPLPIDAKNVNEEVLSIGLLRTTMSQDSTISENLLEKNTTSNDNQDALKDICSSHLKDNGVIVTSNVNDVSFSCGNGQNLGKLESGIVAAQQPIISSMLNLTYDKHTKNLVKQNSLDNEGTANGVAQNNDIPCKTDAFSASAVKGPKMLCSKLTSNNEYAGKQNRKPTEHQNTIPESDKCTSKLLFQRDGEDGMLKAEELGLNKLPELPNGCLQHEAIATIEREDLVVKCSQADPKRKKLGKPLIKGQCFGRKQLFMTSIFMRKRKKHKKSTKHHPSSKKVTDNKILENLCIDDQGLSTSESIKANDVASMRSSKKRSRSSSSKGNKGDIVKDVIYCNSGDVLNRDSDSSSKDDVMLATSDQPRMPLNTSVNQMTAEVDVYGNSPVQKGITSLLMSLKEATVPRWDDVQLLPSQSHDTDNAQHDNIGYVLDEWDEEYDRGKRKKVKKSSRVFGGANPFQEIANIKIQQTMKMRVNQIGLGNQPLRI